MRLVWPVWGGRASRRSRPRVALAVRAARAALLTAPAPARSADWARGILVAMPAVALAGMGEGGARPLGGGLSP
ncbi:MAG TPA: hypothetical protein VGR57_20575, partial [Ktedonobacterales bacterium]|nr:hypothetical protein [Ktedonobacterales bacterium]